MTSPISFLKTGSVVGFYAPSGPADPRKIEPALKIIDRWGLKYTFSPHAFEKFGYLSAPIEDRLADLHYLLRDPNISALWSIRGGYGSVHLLEKINYQLIREVPHLFIGFSDVTALLLAIYSQTGLPSLSGMAPGLHLSPQNPYLTISRQILFGKRLEYSSSEFPPNTLRCKGVAKTEGILIGGTLSILASLCGTKYLPQLSEPFILIIEDVDEPYYRIDRYWQQLRLSGFLDQMKALILGKFLYRNLELDILPIIEPFLNPDITIVENFPYGHVISSTVVPIGVPATLNTSPFSLKWDWA